jgi:hypothetical protein
MSEDTSLAEGMPLLEGSRDLTYTTLNTLPLDTSHNVRHTAETMTKRGETLRELKLELEEVTHRAKALKTAIQALEAVDERKGVPHKETKPKPKGPLAELNNPEAVRTILSRSNRSLSVGELLEVLEKQGHPITTTNPYQTIFKVLRGRPELFLNEGGKWRLKMEGK